MDHNSPPQQATSGAVKLVLRAEGFFVLIVASDVYHHLHPLWAQFFWLFFIPDISFIGYVLGKKIGAITYNTMHSYVLPLVLLSISYIANAPEIYPIVAIWIAHIGFDRALGYGLKYATGFGDTHLGKIGRASV